jgi:hypothetical protein
MPTVLTESLKLYCVIFGQFTVLVRTFGRDTHGSFLNLFRHSAGRVIGQLQRPLPTQDKKIQKYEDNHHSLSVISTHDLSVQAIKAYSDRAATGTDHYVIS